MNRCVGCRWRTPQKYGGEGILCLQNDGKCPQWAVQWALAYRLNANGKPRKGFASDEDLLEAMRI